MTELPPDDQALLALARGGDAPTETDRVRIRAALVASLGPAATNGDPAVNGSSGAARRAWHRSPTAIRALVVAAIAGAVVVGVVVTRRPARAPPTPAPATFVPEAPSLAPTATALPAPDERLGLVPGGDPAAATARAITERAVPRVTARSAVAAEPASARALPSAPAPALASAFASASPSTTAAATTERVAAEETTVVAEMALVRAGIAALHAHDPGRALALFDEHARAYPDGALAEERAGERILALCDLGQVADARAAAAVFLRIWSHSPLAARVRASCAAPSNP